MNIPESTLNEWLDALKDSADSLYRDSRLNAGITKVEMSSEATGIEEAVGYIVKKLGELKNDRIHPAFHRRL